MERVRIVTDSTADLPPPIAARLGVTVVPLNVHFGTETFRDGIDLTTETFYKRLVSSGVHPTTSQPSAGAFLEVYRRLAAECDTILSIHISAKLSGTLNSAILARDEYLRNGGSCRIDLIDSQLASLGLGIIVVRAAEAALAGASGDEVRALVLDMLPKVQIRFLVDTLEYLQRGGRIGRAQALIGTLLNVKPYLKLEEGEVRPVEKVRTRAKGLERLVEFVRSFPKVERMGIVHVNTPGDVEALIARLDGVVRAEQTLVGQVGPVVGTHAGPGTIGIAVYPGD